MLYIFSKSLLKPRVFGILGSIFMVVSIPLLTAHVSGALLMVSGLLLLTISLVILSRRRGSVEIAKHAQRAASRGIISASAFAFASTYASQHLDTLISIARGELDIGLRGEELWPLTVLVVSLLIAWIFFIAMSINIHRCFKKLSTVTGIWYFKASGILYLIGSITYIVLIGILLVMLAAILQTLGFVRIKDS